MTAPDKMWMSFSHSEQGEKRAVCFSNDPHLRAEPYHHQRTVDELVEALEEAVGFMEDCEVQIDGDWGSSRSLEKIEQDGDLSQPIITARALIAKHRKGG